MGKLVIPCIELGKFLNFNLYLSIGLGVHFSELLKNTKKSESTNLENPLHAYGD